MVRTASAPGVSHDVDNCAQDRNLQRNAPDVHIGSTETTIDMITAVRIARNRLQAEQCIPLTVTSYGFNRRKMQTLPDRNALQAARQTNTKEEGHTARLPHPPSAQLSPEGRHPERGRLPWRNYLRVAHLK